MIRGANWSGAVGTFTVTHDISKYTRANVFSAVGKKTDLFLRFPTVADERGAVAAKRVIRGFSVKFYTEEGNRDVASNNTPVFFLRDPLKFPDLNHAVKRDPKTNVRNADNSGDVWTLLPEALHQVTNVMSDRGIPASQRHMHGFGGHTLSFINAASQRHWVKFTFKTRQSIKNLSDADISLTAKTAPEQNEAIPTKRQVIANTTYFSRQSPRRNHELFARLVMAQRHCRLIACNVICDGKPMDTLAIKTSKPIHPAWMRVTHWLNAIAVVIMVLSGWQIYNASPIFLFKFPREITLGGWLGGAIQWHFAAMWLFAVNGIAYLVLNIFTGRFHRKFFPINVPGLLGDVKQALSGKLAHDDLSKYNMVQKIAYLLVTLALTILLLSGLVVWKSVQFPLLLTLMNGYDNARVVHFWAMAFVVIFLAVHLLMVALVPRTLLTMARGK